jgi:hypothetical protein
MAHQEFSGGFSWITGLYSVAASLILILVGRRSSRFHLLSYIGLVGISLGVDEAVIYPLLHASGGNFGDGLTIVAIVSALLALLHQSLRDRLAKFCLPAAALEAAASIHWGLGTLLTIAAANGLSNWGEWLWIIASGTLGITILWQGRQRSTGIYLGFGQWVGTIGYWLHKVLPSLSIAHWGAVIASIIAYGVFSIDWEAWGWSRKPWHDCATGLPLAIAGLTAGTINPPCLLLTAAFYGTYAWKTDRIRLSYFGLLLSIWGLCKWLLELGVTDPIWYTAIVSLAILFIVEVEPDLQVNTAREQRHWIRCLALGLFCITLFYDPWDRIWLRGIMTIALSLGMSLIGIVRRTRADLYIGTVTFVLGVLRLLWLFIADYSLLLWAIGIALGLLLIWVAATFESRRSQTIAWVEYWLSELDDWA